MRQATSGLLRTIWTLTHLLQIFMFGGLASDSTTTLAQAKVFVLLLPSFIWQAETIVPKTGRFLHSCNLVGQRQTMIIGGIITDST